MLIGFLSAGILEEDLHGWLGLSSCAALSFFLVIHHANTTLSFQEPLFAPPIWEPTEVVFEVSFLCCFCALCWNLFPGGELIHQSLSSVISLLSHVTCHKSSSGSQGYYFFNVSISSGRASLPPYSTFKVWNRSPFCVFWTLAF